MIAIRFSHQLCLLQWQHVDGVAITTAHTPTDTQAFNYRKIAIYHIATPTLQSLGSPFRAPATLTLLTELKYKQVALGSIVDRDDCG